VHNRLTINACGAVEVAGPRSCFIHTPGMYLGADRYLVHTLEICIIGEITPKYNSLSQQQSPDVHTTSQEGVVQLSQL